MEDNSEIFNKLIVKTEDTQVTLFVSFEPFSPYILNEIKKLKSNIEKNRLFQSVIDDERTLLLVRTGEYKTVKYPNHNTNDEYWAETLEMANTLNGYGCDVCFLPEVGDIPKGTKRADAVLKYQKHWFIADFKYFHSHNANTLSEDLNKGFQQADTVVLKIQNADIGIFKSAVEYLKRNDIKLGNIFLINEYGKMIELTAKQLKTDRYKYLVKGFI